MAQASDSMENPWWRAMYFRTLHEDPVNRHYGRFNVSGLNQPIAVDANDVYSVALNRHQDGLDAYSMGAVSPMAVPHMGDLRPVPTRLLGASAQGPNNRPQGGISGCAAKTGNPSGCATVFLGQTGGDPVRFSRLG